MRQRLPDESRPPNAPGVHDNSRQNWNPELCPLVEIIRRPRSRCTIRGPRAGSCDVAACMRCKRARQPEGVLQQVFERPMRLASVSRPAADIYLQRELSILAFNERVLAMAVR